MFQARLAEMHLRIDDAGQHVQAARVDHLARLGGIDAADGGDPPGTDADIADADAVLIDDGASLQHEVERGAHGSRSPRLASGPRPAYVNRTPVATGAGKRWPRRKIALLPDRGVVSVAGPDAAKLLQGVITNDMDLIDGQGALHAGLLSPQGKILFEFFVVRQP